MAIHKHGAVFPIAGFHRDLRRKLHGLRLSVLVVLAACVAGASVRLMGAAGVAKGVLGLKRVVAFTYFHTKAFDPRQLRSVTFIGPVGPTAWQYWQGRGVVAGVGHTWFDLLHSPVDKAVENLTNQNFGGNPLPVVMIDEFGFDFGGRMDRKSAEILRLAKRRKPGLHMAVWEMRGPVPQVLADAYRDTADLVLMESYVGGEQQYWWIAAQVWAARIDGILPKTIVVLGLGNGGRAGENWAASREELERQIRFVRLIAPDSPGIGFYGGTPELLASADALCAHLFRHRASGRGLPTDARALAKTFFSRHAKPTLVVSPDLVEPNYDEDGRGLVQPVTMRPYIINLGDEDARNVRIRLRNPPDKGGDVFAEGVVPIVPKRSAVVGVIPATGKWNEWVGKWDLEVDAPGCEVLNFHMKH
jgi:hypothetical protein